MTCRYYRQTLYIVEIFIQPTNKMKPTFNRRSFLKGSVASLALSSLAANAAANPAPLISKNSFKPTQKYTVALIGAGWYGKSDLFRLIQVADVDVVALCDADSVMLNEAADLITPRLKSKKRPKLYEDYRKLLKETKPELVLIGTPDHWHALIAIDAIKSGAHVYLQKPISVDVIEGEAIVAAARKYNRTVQIGTQRRSTPFLVDAKKRFVDSGMLGKVSHVEICCYYHMRNTSNPPLEPIPERLNYDLWTGPAPLRPYDGLPHKRWWRAFMEYGNGITGDMCVHMFDTTRWMLSLGWPTRISSHGGIYVNKEAKSNISDTQNAIFEYDDLNVVWTHRSWGEAADKQYPWSFKFYGDKGTLEGSTTQYDFTPIGKSNEKAIHMDVTYEREEYPEDVTEENIELNAAPATRQHMLNFLEAIETNTRPIADVEEGHISTASCILANIAMELGRPLVYDSQTRQVIGDSEATAMLMRPYREGYVHPLPSYV
jgi:predicted dehydrogenase